MSGYWLSRVYHTVLIQKTADMYNWEKREAPQNGSFGYMYTGDNVIDGIACNFSRGREQDGLPEGALRR